MLAFLVVIGSAASASAQGESMRTDREREVLVLREERREVAGLYAGGASVLSAATVMGLLGFATMGGGDVVGVGVFALFALPAVAPLGLILMSLAIGYDIGLGHWDRGRVLGDRVAGQRELTSVITWTYAVGAAVLIASVVAFVVVSLFAPVAAVVPAITGGLGIATIFVGAGMDIAAGAWSGFRLSLAPSAEGFSGALSGRF